MSQYPNQTLQTTNPNPQFTNYSNPPHVFDPYANSGYNPPNYSSFSSQPINYLTPSLDSSTWVVTQSAPIAYSPAVQPLNNEVIASTSYTAPPNYNLIGQRLVNRVPKKKKKPKAIPKQPSMNQSVRCEVCKVECTTVQVYEMHLSGKKHTKGLQKLYPPALKPAAEKTAGSGGEVAPGNSSKAADLEVKKQKLLESGTTVQALRTCTICNVVCNGEVVYSAHVVGRKHILNAAKEHGLGSVENSNKISRITQEADKQSNPTKKRKNGESSPACCDVCNISCTSKDGLQTHLTGKKHKKTLQRITQETDRQSNSTKKREKGESSPACCDVCKISCTSEDGLQAHLSGKKHKKTLQGTQGNKTANPSVGVNETPDASKPSEPSLEKKKKSPTNDVNVKKQNILKSGTDASAVRTCSTCNVVCNSDTVFKAHIGSKKHGILVKQAEGPKAGIQTVYPSI